MSSKRYPEEFKIEAVRQVVDRGHFVASVAARLDITTVIPPFLTAVKSRGYAAINGGFPPLALCGRS